MKLNIPEFSFTILVGKSVFFVALLMFKLFTSLRMSSFWTSLNEKWDLELQNFLIATILGWFRYLTIAIRSGSFIFSQIGSSQLYCWVSRFWIIFEKKAFKTFAALFSVLMISSFSIRINLSLDYFSHLNCYNALFSFSLVEKHNAFVVSRNFFCFHYSYFWEICF